MKKLLFVDRDGTLIEEPPAPYQVDSLEKLHFLPGVIRNLYRIQHELGYQLVMVTNQDGLGTTSFPEESFWVVHERMMSVFENQGIEFLGVHIDPTYKKEGKNTRKPGTGMLTEYIEGNFDLKHSYVIGDRPTDIILAANLGAKGIMIGKSDDSQDDDVNQDLFHETLVLRCETWGQIYRFLRNQDRRTVSLQHNYHNIQLNITVGLDGPARTILGTGIPLFDHMLNLFGRNSRLFLGVEVESDTKPNVHAVIEGTALGVGKAVVRALNDKSAIARYGFASIPVDDSLAQVTLDIAGPPYCNFEATFQREKLGNFPTEMIAHFFSTFCRAASCTLHLSARGQNDYHKSEALFRAFGRSLAQAVTIGGKDVF